VRKSFTSTKAGQYTLHVRAVLKNDGTGARHVRGVHSPLETPDLPENTERRSSRVGGGEAPILVV
jgi:hypothetical protein